MKRFLLCLAAAASLLSLSAQTVYDFKVKDAEGREVALFRPHRPHRAVIGQNAPGEEPRLRQVVAHHVELHQIPRLP